MAKREKKFSKITKMLMEEYDLKTAGDIHNALKEVLGDTLEKMLEAELDGHLGYEKNDYAEGITDNRRNGTTQKKVKAHLGELEIEVPRDRDGEFEPVIVPKRQKDISDIEERVLAMVSRGMSYRDIGQTIEEIYGFNMSKDMITKITDKIWSDVLEWRNRELKECYPFVFVDCMYVSVKSNGVAKKQAIYTILGYTLEGNKELLGLWMNESESKSSWMNIFDEIKQRGVKDILFISMDGVSGLEAGAKSVFENVTVQRCIVHLVRNSVKFIPSKDMKEFCKDLKKVYAANNLEMSNIALEELNNKWSSYPGALRVWNDNYIHVEQLYDLGSEVRRIMYTTNAVEAVHSSLRKVCKKGSFESEKSLFKMLYLRIDELESKWKRGHVRNWSMVLNQLMIDDKYQSILDQYL